MFRLLFALTAMLGLCAAAAAPTFSSGKDACAGDGIGGRDIMLDLQMFGGGLVSNAQVAVALTEVFVAHLYGEQELERQRPLVASDDGDLWQISGSYNIDRKIEGQGPVTFWVCKRDARVVEIENPKILKVPPEVKEIIERELKKQESQ